MRQLFPLLFLLPFITACTSQQPLTDYLREHRQVVDTQDESTEELAAFFDSSFFQNRLFLIGERHGMAETYDFEWEVLQLIKERTNFRYYLAETGYSSSWLLNRYLKTGREHFLRQAIYPSFGSYGWNQERYQRWQHIYQLNQTLPEEDRIRVLGVDLEHQPEQAVRHLSYLLKQSNYPRGTFPALDSFLVMDSTGRWSLIQLYRLALQFQMQMKTDSAGTCSTLGDICWEVQHITQNLIEIWNLRHAKRWNQYRESVIFGNFRELYLHRQLQGQTFFGLWGRDHIYQAPNKDLCWFACRVQQSELPISDHIVSLNAYYTNSKQMLPTGFILLYPFEDPYINLKWFNDNSLFFHIPGIRALRKAAPDDVAGPVIFKLNTADSPFRERNLLIKGNNEFPTTAYIQYAVLFQNATPTTPLEE